MVVAAKVEQEIDLNTLIKLYLLRCDVEGKSPFTVVAYSETLRLFQRIAEEESVPADVPAITPAHIYAYLGRVAETGVSLETRHRRHREVRSFFSWLERMGYIEESPFARIKNVRLPQKIVQPYSPEEVGKILSVCDERSELGARDRAIVLLLLDCGLRLNELVQLELGDVDFEEQRIRVRCGKGNKQRVVRFGERAKEAVWGYVEHHRGSEGGQLFRSSKADQPLTRNLVRVRMQHIGRVAGVPRTHAHRFRHTFATWAIENDARELDVQHSGLVGGGDWYITLAGPAAEGTIGITYGPYLYTKGAEQVWQQEEDVMKQYKPDVPLNSQTGYGWGVAQLIVKALEAAGRDLTPESVAKGAESIKDWCCEMCFAPVNLGPDDHRPNEVIFFVEVKNGKWEFTGEYASVETTPASQELPALSSTRLCRNPSRSSSLRLREAMDA